MAYNLLTLGRLRWQLAALILRVTQSETQIPPRPRPLLPSANGAVRGGDAFQGFFFEGGSLPKACPLRRGMAKQPGPFKIYVHACA